jgi:rhamnosyltransferase
MLRVAGVVVLFNPPQDLINNIVSYINQIEQLYVVDNSEKSDDQINALLKSYAKIKKVDNNENIGMAAALNLAANKAVENGFDLLLTMDQDSRISEGFVNEMLKEFENDDLIGILSPHIVHTENPMRSELAGLVEVATAITSGSIIRLTAHQKIGGFLDNLFIDYVDNEYCLRMRTYGYKIFKHNSIYLYHELGDVTLRKFFFMKIYPTNHSPLRWYYRTRNRFYLYSTYKNKFPDYIKFDKGVFIKEILKIIIYEKEKTKKIKMIIKGYLDFKHNQFGKLTMS